MGSATSPLGAAPPGCSQGLLIVLEVQEPTRCLLKVSGELDLATADLLTGAIDKAAADYQEVGVDLSALSFWDVSAQRPSSEHCSGPGRTVNA